MYRAIRNSISGWWRKHNRPLVSELPKPVLLVEVIYSSTLIILLIVGAFLYERFLDQSLLQGYSIGILLLAAVGAFEILFYYFSGVLLLLLSPAAVEKSRLLRKSRDNFIKGFKISNLSWMLIIIIAMSAMFGVIVPAMYNWYLDLKKEELVLGAMWDGTRSLDDEWLKERDIPMQKYASVRQNVIENGWDSVRDSTVHYKDSYFFLTVFCALLYAVFVMKILAGAYLMWRYYKRD